MNNKQKVICIKKCVSDTYYITNVGDIFYIDESVAEKQQKRTEYQLMKQFNFSYSDINKLFGITEQTEQIPLYPKYNLFMLDKYNIKKDYGEFDARNFMTQAEYRDSQINSIFTDDDDETKKVCKLLN